MKLENIEENLKEKLQNYEVKWGKDERALHLVEEVGEFAEIILQYKGFKKPSKDLRDIKVALADILDDILALTILYDISFNDLFEEVLKEEK